MDGVFWWVVTVRGGRVVGGRVVGERVVGGWVVCVLGGEVRDVAGRVVTVRRRVEEVRADCLAVVVLLAWPVCTVVELRRLVERS